MTKTQIHEKWSNDIFSQYADIIHIHFFQWLKKILQSLYVGYLYDLRLPVKSVQCFLRKSCSQDNYHSKNEITDG